MRGRVRRIVSGALAGAAAIAAMPAAIALPPPSAPRTRPTGTPYALPTGRIYPVGTPLLFVVDEPVNSGKTLPGTGVPIHLRDALVVGGVTIAPAGTAGTMTVVATQPARAPDTDGAIEIRVEPLILPSGRILPLRAIHEYLTTEVSAGALTTRSALDQVADVFVPYLSVYQAFRKGHQFVIPRDSIIKVQTAATVDATNPKAVAITTAAPLTIDADPVHSEYTPVPLATPFAVRPNARFTVKPRRTAAPSASPSGSASPGAATPSPGSSATPPIGIVFTAPPLSTPAASPTAAPSR